MNPAPTYAGLLVRLYLVVRASDDAAQLARWLAPADGGAR